MPRTPSFRFSAKNIFLTYPRCPIPKTDALQQLKTLLKAKSPLFIRVSRELHEDGEPDLHCLIKLDCKFETKNKQFFDLTHPSCQRQFHPNIQPARNPNDVLKYISKHNDFADHGVFNSTKKSCDADIYRRALSVSSAEECSRTKSCNADIYRRALSVSSAEECLQIIKANDPKSFILHYEELVYAASQIFKVPPAPSSPSSSTSTMCPGVASMGQPKYSAH